MILNFFILLCVNLIFQYFFLSIDILIIESEVSCIKKTLIFGSFADGTRSPLSDIDIMVVGDMNEDDVIVSISRLENKFEREVNYYIFN